MNYIKDYIKNEEKYNYVDGLLRSIPYHLSRIAAIEDKILELDVYVQQGFSHGKGFDSDSVPQKHYRGDITEKLIIQCMEKRDKLESKLNYEKEQIASVENWLQSLPEMEKRLIEERYFKNLSYDALAFRFGKVAINTVKSKIQKILLTYPDDGELLMNNIFENTLNMEF